MDLWLQTEVRMRRDDALRVAHRKRLVRLAESGRSRSIRRRLADGADILSNVLAALARTLRADAVGD